MIPLKNKNTSQLNRAARLFEQDDRVVLAYVFGSVARGEAGPMSDVDFAVLLRRGGDAFDVRLKLMESMASALKTDNVDLVVLNDAPLLLRYEVVRGGRLLKDEPSARVSFETAVVREYLDTAFLRAMQLRTVKQQVRKGAYFG